MNNDEMLLEAFDARARRREDRRNFFKLSGGFAVGAAGGAVLSACSSSAVRPPSVSGLMTYTKSLFFGPGWENMWVL